MTFLQDIQKHASRPENGTEMKNEVASVGEGGGEMMLRLKASFRSLKVYQTPRDSVAYQGQH